MMPSVVTLGARTLSDRAEFQQQVVDLFDQDYEKKFGVTFSHESPNFDHLLRSKYHRAHLILRWIMGIGSDHPVRMTHEHRSLGAEAQCQFDDFLYDIREELPELWRLRASLIYIPL